MSEIDEKEIERRFEVISQFEPGSEVTARDLEKVRKKLAEQTSGQRTKDQEIWRIIMKSRITKIATAAAIIIAVMLVMHWFGRPVNIAKPAYGITDLPELIKNARTLHMRGWVYFPQAGRNNSEPVKLEFEYWFDIENGCYRLYKPGGIDRDTGKPRYYTTVSDGRFIMSEAYRQPAKGKAFKLISFTKLSPFKARLETYKNSYSSLMQIFGNIDQIEGSTKVGQEEIDGIVYDIWQTESYPANDRVNRIRTWMASESGNIGRVMFWQKMQKDEADLRLIFDLHTIELGVVPPEGIFDTNPPDGYKLDNTKETAQIDTLGVNLQKACQKDYTLSAHIGFTLNDGSVILGWSCPDKNRNSQTDLFENLTFGGKLPELAGKIETLTAVPPKPGINYLGHHLVYTQKDGIFYEWSLYVPDKKPPARNLLMGYNLNIKYLVNESNFEGRPSSIVDDLVIDSNRDFNMWVQGAIGWLSDDGQAPEQVTSESVLQLAEKIRSSLTK